MLSTLEPSAAASQTVSARRPPALVEVIRTHRLPSIPAVAVRLIRAFADSSASIEDICKIVESDPALAGKIVHAANSVQFSAGRPVHDVKRATLMLGRRVIASIALSFTLSEASLRRGPREADFRAYWLQSIVQATAMTLLSERYAGGRTGEFFLAGLLMDIGRLALLTSCPHEYGDILETSRRNAKPLCELEAASLGIAHPEVSAGLLKAWGLSAEMTAAVRRHHEAEPLAADDPQFPDAELHNACRAASAVGEYLHSTRPGEARRDLLKLMKAGFGASEHEVELLLGEVHRRLEATADLFNIETETLQSPLEIMGLALQQLSVFAVEQNLPNVDAATVPPESSEPPGPAADVTEGGGDCPRPPFIDPATSVYRRGFLDECLREAVESARKTSGTIGLLLLAPQFNESSTGQHESSVDQRDVDLILKQFADVVLPEVRPCDVVARYDAGRLAVLAYDLDAEALRALARRLLRRIHVDLAYAAGGEAAVSGTIAGSCCSPGRAAAAAAARVLETAESAFQEADGGDFVLRDLDVQ